MNQCHNQAYLEDILNYAIKDYIRIHIICSHRRSLWYFHVFICVL